MTLGASRFISRSAEETRANAAAFAARSSSGTVVCLHGDLGAGKTEWVKGLLEALGSAESVTSPTFSLVHEYREGRWPVYHWDLYRLHPGTDWSAIDLPDQLPGEGLTVVEWPERYPDPWPGSTWHIRLTVRPDESREIQWSQGPDVGSAAS